MNEPRVKSIHIFPIKSLDGITVERASIIESGLLENDRRFALFNEEGKFLRGKNAPLLLLLRTSFDFSEMKFKLAHKSFGELNFHFDDRTEIEKFFSDYLKEKVEFKESKTHGFPDDTAAHGPTVVSFASLEEVNRWFPEYSIEEVIRKFRTSIVIEESEIFWEDKLYAEIGSQQEFVIGEVKFFGSNACARCTVPTRNSFTSEQNKNFQLRFIEMRKKTLPVWAIPSRFDHYYRFAVNTIVPQTETNKEIKIGDKVLIR